MQRRRSIVTIQPHLEYGGAERQTVIQLNKLAARGNDCHLILHKKKGGLIEQLSPSVSVHDLGVENHLATPYVALCLHRKLRALPPSLVIVKLWSSILATALVADRNCHHVFNYCEDLDPADHADYIPLGRAKQRIVRRIFRAANHLTANTHTVAESMVKQYGIEKPEVVPSVIDRDAIQSLATYDPTIIEGERSEAVKILTVGSLIERKGLRQIYTALSEACVAQEIDWHIVGEGPLRHYLEECSRERRSANSNLQILVRGGTPNPYPIMASSDILMHGASSEAFGIVLIEALALDTPVVAAEAIGSREIRNTLGDRPELLALYDPSKQGTASAAILDMIQHRSTIGEPHDGAAYVAPYDILSTAKKWEQRHDELLP